MTSHLETIHYRILIVQPNSDLVLAISTASGYRLPSVEIPTGLRQTLRIRETARSVWNLHIFILHVFVDSAVSTGHVIAELLTPGFSEGFKLAPLGSLPDSDLSEDLRVQTLAVLDGSTSHPFSRIGWIDQVTQWLESVMKCEIFPKLAIEQYNASGPFSLIRFPATNGSHYWFKATGAPNAHEFPLTQWLSKRCRPYVPKVVAARPERNAWLMSEEGKDGTKDPSDFLSFLQNAVESMATLQTETMGQREALLHAGAFDQGIGAIYGQAASLFSYLEDAVRAQTSSKVPVLSKSRLIELREIFERVCVHVERLGIPDSIVHGDLNLGNILRCSTHCQFIDWSETYVGNPLFAFEHLLLLNPELDSDRKRSDERTLRFEYTAVLSEKCDPAQIDKAFIYMPFLAAVSTLLGRGNWFTTSLANDPKRQAFSRTMARYMDRAAKDLKGCLA